MRLTCIRGERSGPQDLPDHFDRGVPKLFVGDDAGDHAEAHGFLGVEASSGQQDVARHRDADVGRQHRGVGGVDDAAQELGRPERGAVTRHADVRHHRHEESAGLADPVHRGDHRCPAVADREEREHLVGEVWERFVAFVGAAAQVSTG